MQPKSIDAHDDGFSLLEAVIGMAIVALTLSAFYSASNICIDATAKARAEEVVAREANQIIALLGIEYPLAEGVQIIKLSGRSNAILTIRPLTVSGSTGVAASLQLFDVELAMGSDPTTPLVKLHTLRIKQINIR